MGECKPILFDTPMVQAIIDGIKTQARRVVKPQPIDFAFECTHGDGFHYIGGNLYECGDCCSRIESRYQSGDILWVREKWCNVNKPDCEPEYYYSAETKYAEDYDPTEWKWRPSIHMPKEAARIFLRVTDVRVERLQEINEAGAVAEGCCTYADDIKNAVEFDLTAKDAYEYLWDSIYAKKGYSWDTNPWVWAYTFERCEKPENRPR